MERRYTQVQMLHDTLSCLKNTTAGIKCPFKIAIELYLRKYIDSHNNCLVHQKGHI